MKSKRIIIILGLILCFQHNTIVAGVETMEIFDFKKLETSGRWFIVNDGVMGGVSEANVSWEPEGFLVFEGILSLDYGGGFASTRTWSDDWQMGGYEGIILSVRGDGKKYQFRCSIGEYLRWDFLPSFIHYSQRRMARNSVPFRRVRTRLPGKTSPGSTENRPYLH